MKDNGMIEDHSTVRALMEAERVNPSLFREQQEFIASVEKRWGRKTTVKDLGPDVLNLSLDPNKMDP
jgi:hypothetical protein